MVVVVAGGIGIGIGTEPRQAGQRSAVDEGRPVIPIVTRPRVC